MTSGCCYCMLLGDKLRPLFVAAYRSAYGSMEPFRKGIQCVTPHQVMYRAVCAPTRTTEPRTRRMEDIHMRRCRFNFLHSFEKIHYGGQERMWPLLTVDFTVSFSGVWRRISSDSAPGQVKGRAGLNWANLQQWRITFKSSKEMTSFISHHTTTESEYGAECIFFPVWAEWNRRNLATSTSFY